MDTMTDTNSSETYQGWANRETWAFNLHWSNDHGLYSEVLADASRYVKEYTDDVFALGSHVVEYVEGMLDEGVFSVTTERMIRKEVGSFWRIDVREVGASVRESLDNES